MLRLLAPLLVLLTFAPGCSSAPKLQESAPLWTKKPTRVFDDNVITFLGKSEDLNAEQAQFKALGQAIEDLVNECSLAPKTARLEDEFDQIEGVYHNAYARIRVDLQSCEEAKIANTLDKIKKISNASWMEKLVPFQTLMEEPEPEALTGDAAIAEERGLFLLRERIAHFKRLMLLPPDGASPPSNEQAAEVLATPTKAVRAYEAAHPTILTGSRTWSQLRKEFVETRANEKARKVKRRK